MVRKVSIQRYLKLVSVELGCYRIVSFLSSIMIEVVLFEEVVSRLIATINEHSQLKIIKLVFFLTTSAIDRFDERYLGWVVL